MHSFPAETHDKPEWSNIKTKRGIQLPADGEVMYGLFYVKSHLVACASTSSLSVRCGFCEGEEVDEEEEELWTVTGGFPGTRIGVLERMSEGTRLSPWLRGVTYEP